MTVHTLIYSENFKSGYPKVGFWDADPNLLMGDRVAIGPVGPVTHALLDTLEILTEPDVRSPAHIAVREAGALAIPFSAMDTSEPTVFEVYSSENPYVWCLLAYGPSLENIHSCHIVQLDRSVMMHGKIPLRNPLHYHYGSDGPTDEERLLRESTTRRIVIDMHLAAEDGNHPFFLLGALSDRTDEMLHKLNQAPNDSFGHHASLQLRSALRETALTCIRYGRES